MTHYRLRHKKKWSVFELWRYFKNNYFGIHKAHIQKEQDDLQDRSGYVDPRVEGIFDACSKLVKFLAETMEI